MADKGRELTDKELRKLVRELSRQYSTEQNRLQRKIMRKMITFNVQDKSRRLLVDNGLMRQEDYDMWRRSELSHGRSVNRIIDDIVDEMLNLNKRSADRINKANERVYRNIYKQSLKDNGLKAARKDGAFRSARIDEYKDRRWNKQKLTSMLMQSIKKGEDAESISKRLAKIVEMNRNSAIRSARTITTGTENSALLDSFYVLREKGMRVRKMWVAVVDERTRVSHMVLNGEVRELEEPFSNGLMHPGDPSGEASEIFNCRCRMTALVEQYGSTYSRG